MPAYVSTSVFSNGTSVENAIESLLDLGISNIELGALHRYEENIVATVAHYDARFLMHNFFPPAPKRLILNIASSDEVIRHASVSFIKDAIDFAEKMDIPIYTIHPGFIVDPIGESDSPGHYGFKFAQNVSGDHKAAFTYFLNSIAEIEKYLEDKEVKVAVETQGATVQKELFLLTRPEEVDEFFVNVKGNKVGLNLNLGHLNLAATAWGFDRNEFIVKANAKTFVVEVSENNGVDDQHQSLKAGSWYLDILKDNYFAGIPVVFSGRNVDEKDIIGLYNTLSEIVGT